MSYKLNIIICFFAFICRAEIKDSVGVLEQNGKKYIIHEVLPKETLFSVARKYNVSINEIKADNPEIAQGLKLNQKLKIIRKSTNENEVSMPQNENYVLHKVETGQTLYAISKKYNVSIDNIKKWNGLEQNELKLGSYIIVGEKSLSTMAAESKITEKKTEISTAKITENETSKSESKKNTNGVFSEKGTASMFETKDGELYYYVMHKSAPIGTIIKITNANDESIFARVIEKLPNSENNLIKLSKVSFSKLGLLNNNTIKIDYAVD